MMAEIPCPFDENTCSCLCNCKAFTANREITVNPLQAEGNEYTYSYTITNPDPAISYVIFCIECPKSVFETTSTNTAFLITGNPNSEDPVNFTRCFTPGCQSDTENSFYLEFDNFSCCRYQGIKVDINPAEDIEEINFSFNIFLPDGLTFGFNSGNIKIKGGQITETINDICMPGCLDKCNMLYNICSIWKKERNILESNKDVFIHFAQLLLPDDLDLSTLTVQELESKIRSISKLENSSANLLCNIAKILEKLNKFNLDICQA